MVDVVDLNLYVLTLSLLPHPFLPSMQFPESVIDWNFGSFWDSQSFVSLEQNSVISDNFLFQFLHLFWRFFFWDPF